MWVDENLVPGERPTWEDHFFQLTAPGLMEELAFRGILLALLDRASPRRVRVVGPSWGGVRSSLRCFLASGTG